MRLKTLLWTLVLACLLLFVVDAAFAGEAAAETEVKRQTLWQTIKDGGLIGLVIILGSFAMMGLVIEHFVSIRESQQIPEELEAQLQQLIQQNRIQDAKAVCEQSDSLLARVVEAGLEQTGGTFGYFDMQTAMQEAGERAVGRLYRKLEWLAFIATTSPMFGLLGTVVGMIQSFNVIANMGGRPSPTDLAGGISKALVTTCMGLIVAIPGIFFVGFFRSRIEAITAEAGAVVEHLMARFKKTPGGKA